MLDKFSNSTIRFAQVASHSGYGTTIHRSVDASHPEYWITNTTIEGAQPTNRFWNTRARAGEAWDADSSATRNEDARWPDGWYDVFLKAWSHSGDTTAVVSIDVDPRPSELVGKGISGRSMSVVNERQR